MFISSYENLRKSIFNSKDIVTMAHLGARAFDSIPGEVVQTTTFVLRNHHVMGCNGVYFRLVKGNNENQKSEMLSVRANCHIANAESFERITGIRPSP
jgi:hypothetical protein